MLCWCTCPCHCLGEWHGGGGCESGRDGGITDKVRQLTAHVGVQGLTAPEPAITLQHACSLAHYNTRWHAATCKPVTLVLCGAVLCPPAQVPSHCTAGCGLWHCPVWRDRLQHAQTAQGATQLIQRVTQSWPHITSTSGIYVHSWQRRVQYRQGGLCSGEDPAVVAAGRAGAARGVAGPVPRLEALHGSHPLPSTKGWG
jgi:hypothetical protein